MRMALMDSKRLFGREASIALSQHASTLPSFVVRRCSPCMAAVASCQDQRSARMNLKAEYVREAAASLMEGEHNDGQDTCDGRQYVDELEHCSCAGSSLKLSAPGEGKL